MNITDIRIRKILTDGRLRAVVSITIDDAIAIHDIKVIEGPERLLDVYKRQIKSSGICVEFLVCKRIILIISKG